MQFTRLRLSGFKSFVEPTELRIEPGLTGIVGPNGCGKSNLVEALGWVMGEGSAKQMRGKGMDDVIFNGASGRPPRNMAEVCLVIDNNDRSAPAHVNDSDFLEISRRIEREAGSLYRINGRETRARDVGLLFADAASGPRSAAIVRQGKIGNLISAKPRDRRAILEEAAGIGGLHSRRHEAELRLRAAETNLTRLDDIMAQIETQLAALKRQARQATRYRNLSEHIRRGEALMFHLRWLDTTDALAKAMAMLEALQSRVADATSAVAVASTAQLEAAEAVPPLRQAEAEAGAALHRLRVARDGLQAEGEQIQQQIVRAENALLQVRQDSGRELSLLADSDTALQKLGEERAALELAQSESAGQGEALQENVTSIANALKLSEAALDEANRRLADLTARRDSLGREVAQTQSRLDRLGEQLAQVTNESASLQSQMPAAPEVEAMAQAALTARAALTDAREAAGAAEILKTDLQKTDSALRDDFQSARNVADRLAAEAKTLAGLLNEHGHDLWPPLVDALAVEPGFEAALGAALGDDLAYPSDEAAPIHWAVLGNVGSMPELPAGAEPLALYVKGAPALALRLSQIGVVDAEMGRRLRDQLLPGQRLVTREGALWRWDGFTSAADAPTAAARRLEMRNRLAHISAEHRVAELAANAAREIFEEAHEKLIAATAHESECRNVARAAEEGLSDALDAQAKAEREAMSRTTRLAALTEAQARLENELVETSAMLQQSQSALDGLEPEAQPRAAVTTLHGEVDVNRATLGQARGALDGYSREVQARQDRLKSVAQEVAAWASRKLAAEQQGEVLRTREAELTVEAGELKNKPVELQLRMNALLDEISSAHTRHQHAIDTLGAAEAALAECDAIERKTRAALAETREELVRCESAVAAAQERSEDLTAQILERLDCAPEATLALAELSPGAALPDFESVERDLSRFKRERENMGAVNLRAEEESQELRDRLDAMTRERADLEGAIARLRQAIGSLNREGRERLLKAFTVVNEHFARLFTHLFGGGHARLELVESDDPLEAGLEILASPPGKRLQSMTLLSGGEQALTAMSLIFAVFLTNPSPICVLDEVDAPLDDANVERFCNLLDEMSRLTETRFLVITHNGVTMARMDRLFGVTMAEQGVSQLVSVDLERAERLRAVG